MPLRRPLAFALSALLALAQAVLPLARAAAAEPPSLNLPSLGESSDDFSLATEKRVGEQVMREIRRDPDYLDDPPLLDYVRAIWAPLVAAAKRRGDIGPDTEGIFPYEVFLIRDRNVNAFALPGGHVGVYLGLLALTDTPDELASVLAHELSHITQHHIARSIAAQSRASTLGMVALILGVLAASRAGSADAANAAIMGSQGYMAQAQISFTRDMEREADRNGLALMTLAGYAPVGMAQMFDKLEIANRLNDNGSYPYLRDHPLSTERIGEALQRISLEPPTPGSPWHLRHVLMQARARALMDSSAAALQRLQGLDRVSVATAVPLRLGALYASALASMQLRDFDRATRAVDAARAALGDAGAPDAAHAADHAAARRAIDQLGVQVALAAGRVDDARRALAAIGPDGSRADRLLRAEADLAAGSPDSLRRCSESLQTWVAEHGDDSQGWQLLSSCAARQGQTLRAVRADAEAQAAIDNLPAAIDRLRAGQALARRSGASVDFIEASVIESRLRDLLARQRQRAAESGKRGGADDERLMR